MVIRFPDISVDLWESFEPYIYPDEKAQYCTEIYGTRDAILFLPLTVRFLMKDLIRQCDVNVSLGSEPLYELACIPCTFGIETVPRTNKEVKERLVHGRFFKAQDLECPQTMAKLLEWSDLNNGELEKIFLENHYIPPMYKNLDISMIIKDHEKFTTMMYYKSSIIKIN